MGFFSPESVRAAGDANQYLNTLQERADLLGLWQSRQWHALLHMPLANSGESRIDSLEFFLSSEGRSDPVAEGHDTLASFFPPRKSVQDEKSPQCLYPARYQWLKEQLSFDPHFLPEQSCPELTLWIEGMEPAGLTLVFPESYLNNPASMFGHTLLRIEPKNSRLPLLAPSVSFSAVTTDTTGFNYAVKGLMGGYPGKFAHGMYVDQVRTYGALENRDIYEYRLDLSATETEFLLYHVWELKKASFDYYFIDENCSYQLLALLEVARPSLDLTDHVQFVALPVETIRLVVAVPELLQEVRYRPSRRTLLQGRIQDFPKDWLKIIQVLAATGSVADTKQWAVFDKGRQAELLETAIELVLYNQAATIGENNAEDFVFQHLLQMRSQLGVGPQLKLKDATPVRPDQGHGTARSDLGVGIIDSKAFVEIGFRPVLHDLLDPSPGYVQGAQVDFFSTVLRYYPEQEQLKLQSFDLLNIVSLATQDDLIRPISWMARIGMEQMRYAGIGDRLTGKAMAGFGVSRPFFDGLQGYFLLGGELLAGNQLEYSWDVGFGPLAGIRGGSGGWSYIFQAKSSYSFFHQNDWIWSFQLVQALHITENVSLRVGVTREQEFDDPSTETVFSLLWYF